MTLLLAEDGVLYMDIFALHKTASSRIPFIMLIFVLALSTSCKVLIIRPGSGSHCFLPDTMPLGIRMSGLDGRSGVCYCLCTYGIWCSVGAIYQNGGFGERKIARYVGRRWLWRWVCDLLAWCSSILRERRCLINWTD